MKKFTAFCVTVFMVLNIFYFGVVKAEGKKETKFSYNSATITPGYDLNLALQNASKLGIDTINISVKVDMPSKKSSNMFIDDEEKAKFKASLKAFSDKGYKIFVEPFPWVEDGVLAETDYDPLDKDSFFNNWTNTLKEVIDLSEGYNVEGILIADNFLNLYKENESWSKVIGYVRKNTKTKIGVKVNWWYNAEWESSSYEYYKSLFNLSYFNKVDYISIPAYFELLESNSASLQDIKSAWISSKVYNRNQPIVKQINELSIFYKKPIFFGEVGYTKFTNCLKEPWSSEGDLSLNEDLQKLAFQGFLETFENNNNVCGYSLFQIGLKESNYYFMDREAGSFISNYLKSK